MAKTSEPEFFSGAGLRWLLAPVALVLLTLAAYLNSLHIGFVFDDPDTLWPVARWVQESRWGEVFTRPSWRLANGTLVYQPMTALSYALDYHWWGQNAFGYHQTNVWLHALAAMFAYALFAEVTKRRGLSFTAAALFAVHPVTTHCVTHLANRGTLLATTGVLAAVWLFAVAGRWRDIRHSIVLAGASGAAGLALLAGATALVLPVLTALYLLAVEPQAGRRRWLWVGGCAVLAAVVLAVRFVVLDGWGQTTPPEPLTWAQRLLATVRAAGISFHSLVVPLRLQLAHRLTAGPWAWRLGEYALGAAVLAVALVLLWRARRAAPALWLGQFWVLVGMVPVWGYAGWTGTLAEHWLYLPLIGMLLIACGIVARFVQRVEIIKISPGMLGCGAAMAVALLLVGTRRFNVAWRDDRLLLAQAVEQSPREPWLRLRYARALTAAGQRAEAIAQYRHLLTLAPTVAAAHAELALALTEAGQQDEALEHFRRAVWMEPRQAQWQFNLAIALEQRREYAAAIAHYRLALAGQGVFAHILNNLAWLLATVPQAELRDGPQAVALARQALEQAGERDVNYLDTLAAALAETGNFNEAAKLAQEAVQLATLRGETDLAATIRMRLKLYLDQKPYRLEP